MELKTLDKPISPMIFKEFMDTIAFLDQNIETRNRREKTTNVQPGDAGKSKNGRYMGGTMHIYICVYIYMYIFSPHRITYACISLCHA